MKIKKVIMKAFSKITNDYTDIIYPKTTSDMVEVEGGGTFTGVATAQTNTSYTTAQLRNVTLSTADMML